MNMTRLIFSLCGCLAATLVQTIQAAPETTAKYETATFAGGCFWCMEPPYDALEGVISTTAGYTGGKEVDPSYKQVSRGRTGHTEAIQIIYDPEKISYAKLLDTYWHNIDPTDATGQFCDKGSQYRSEIFVHNKTQQQLAVQSKNALQKLKPFKGPVVTQVTMATAFYPAEDYHQNYYQRNPIRYKYYRYGCGRDQRLEALWGKQGKKD